MICQLIVYLFLLCFAFPTVSERNGDTYSPSDNLQINGQSQTNQQLRQQSVQIAAISTSASPTSGSPGRPVVRCDCDTSVKPGPSSSPAYQHGGPPGPDSTTSPVVTANDEVGSGSGPNQASPQEALDHSQSVPTLLSTQQTATKSKTIFIITPTYVRATQMADMTRLAQTLMLVRNIFWIVVEDATALNVQVSELLERTAIPHAHLLGPRPVTHKDKRSGRGVSNRLKALDWLRQEFKGNTSVSGVIYFADDDNAYDVRVFEEMRTTDKVSVFPVGTIAKTGVSTPVFDHQGKIVAFHDPFISRRKFAVDMAGFAVDLQLFLGRPKATMPYKVGYEEDYFLRSLAINIGDLEPKADMCTKVYVWHVKTKDADFPVTAYLKKHPEYSGTNLVSLYNNVLRTT
ncbi:Galactosylgalactosylxylosylprotein 3-beta-glucuronosyltransferase P [Halotydeus destructor]|nr:Galactosylgalactosylxylosylprotein 3-beta-glucuronosyltransferase P [Halotydeus destructor]